MKSWLPFLLFLGACRNTLDVSDLSLDRNTVSLQPGATAALTLSRLRSDQSLDVALVDAPSGVSADPVHLAAGMTQVTITLRAMSGASLTSAPRPSALILSGGENTAQLRFFIAVAGAPGTLDTTFGDAGSVTLPFPQAACAMDATGAGGIVVGGGQDTGTKMIELDALGKPVAAFALRDAPPGLGGRVIGLRVSAADVRILAVSEVTQLGGATEVAFARLSTDGTPANSFGLKGWVTVPSPAVSRAVLEVNAAGDILAVLAGDDHVTCVSTIGEPCNQWGGYPSSSVQASLQAIALRGDGRVLGTGVHAGSGVPDAMLVARWSTNGAPDASFGGGSGQTTVANSEYGMYGAAITSDEDRIAVARLVRDTAADRVEILRFLDGGEPDTSFVGGPSITLADRPNDPARAIRGLFRDTDGNLILLLENELGVHRLSRFDTTGTPDPSLQGQVLDQEGAQFCGARLQPGTGRLLLAVLRSDGLHVERYWL